jgi:hypothetical protein
LGAGHSQGFGLPGTAEITAAVEGGLLGSRYRESYEHLCGRLHDHFKDDFNFEIVAAALEMALLLKHRNGLIDNVVPEIYAEDVASEIAVLRHDVSLDAAQEMYRSLLRAIALQLRLDQPRGPGSETAASWNRASTFYAALRRRSELDVATLNYDLSAERVIPDAVDGFIADDDTLVFDSKNFLGSDPRSRIADLHGALDYAMVNGSIRRSDAFAGASPEFEVRPDRVVASSLITGGDKPSKLTIQPFAIYHAWFAQRLLSSPRVLIVGYGAADQYLNAWILAAAKHHGERGRFAIIDRFEGRFPWRTMGLATFALGHTTIDTDYFHAALWGYGYQSRVYISSYGFPPTSDESERIVEFLHS